MLSRAMSARVPSQWTRPFSAWTSFKSSRFISSATRLSRPKRQGTVKRIGSPSAHPPEGKDGHNNTTILYNARAESASVRGRSALGPGAWRGRKGALLRGKPGVKIALRNVFRPEKAVGRGGCVCNQIETHFPLWVWYNESGRKPSPSRGPLPEGGEAGNFPCFRGCNGKVAGIFPR